MNSGPVVAGDSVGGRAAYASEKCKEPFCHAPDVACSLGEDDFRQCTHWIRAGATRGSSDGDPDALLGSDGNGSGAALHGDVTLAGLRRAPWSGSALGLADLDLVAARGRARLLAIVGPHNAGKTTMLSAVYLALSRHGQIGPDRFAGSYTLGGWEAVAHGMRWRPGAAPGFPPHTPSGAGRAPGLLHLALRRPEGTLMDVLVTDAPGEWFTRWAYDRESDAATGARWVAHHADAFLFVLDSEALAGPTRGEARGNIARLAQRLGVERGDRPVAAVWTKSDICVTDDMRAGIDDILDRFLPGAARFALSVQLAAAAASPPEGLSAGDGFLKVLGWAIRAEALDEVAREADRPPASDPFLAFRVRGAMPLMPASQTEPTDA